MDAQSESCEPPPCDPQPPGKIRKAFKLFGKRKPGSSVASIFSMRGKGDGGPKSPPSISKTLEDAPMEEFTSENMNSETTPTRHSISSLTSAKSLSFLNMLRKGRRGFTGERQAQTESQRPGRQRKGLKGLFGTVRWRGKEKEDEEEEEPQRRNTAPISKLETKQPTGQTSKSSTHTGTTSVRKASISETAASVAKLPSALAPSHSTSMPAPILTSATMKSPTKSPPGITPSFISSKRAEDHVSMDLREDLLRQEGTDNRDSAATQSISKAVKRGPATKPTTLSKIPVCGGGRPAKLHHRDSQPNGDDDHSNLPTPVHEEESPFTLSRESSSKEALSDVSTESGAVTPTLSHSQEDILDGKLSLQTHPAAGATSLTRESKIPIKHGSTATYHSVQGRAEAARSKIPVSKMPVRRTSNKPAPTATAAITRK
ncbi:hypothetical protein PO909_022738 [Leuciscus waleckii]